MKNFNREESYLHLKEKVYNILKEKLADDLKYHSVWHTFTDILGSVERLGTKENIDSKSLILLKCAAIFHDYGYIERYDDNEIIGAENAKIMMAEAGFPLEEVKYVEKIILATQVYSNNDVIYQKPGEDILCRIICDSDMDNLGRNDFFDLSIKLVKEMIAYGAEIEYFKWWNKQLKLLQHHTYFTESNRKDRFSGKKQNIDILKNIITNYNGAPVKEYWI